VHPLKFNDYLDDPSIVLDYTQMGINDDECECLIPPQQRLAADGIRLHYRIEGLEPPVPEIIMMSISEHNNH
jgi:hypothetical protein